MSDANCREFECDGEHWIAWASGSGAYGTGHCGLGNVEAIHFASASDPAVPIFEALAATGRLGGLFEEELRALLRGARRVVSAADLPATARRKGRTRSLHDHGPSPSGGAAYE